MKHERGAATKTLEFKLTSQDKATLEVLYPLAEGIARLFGKNCEVVVHSLEDLGHSVIKIVNGHVTGRSVGSPMTDYGLKILSEAKTSGDDVFGHYHTKLDDGRLLKSVSVLVRNTEGNPIGFLCINFDLSAPLLEFARQFSPDDVDSSEKSVEHFPSNLNDLVNRMLEMIVTRFGNQKEFSTSERNRAIVTELYKRGMFKIAGVIDVLAKKMGISRYTVYNYIREAKLELGEEW